MARSRATSTGAASPSGAGGSGRCLRIAADTRRRDRLARSADRGALGRAAAVERIAEPRRLRLASAQGVSRRRCGRGADHPRARIRASRRGNRRAPLRGPGRRGARGARRGRSRARRSAAWGRRSRSGGEGPTWSWPTSTGRARKPNGSKSCGFRRSRTGWMRSSHSAATRHSSPSSSCSLRRTPLASGSSASSCSRSTAPGGRQTRSPPTVTRRRDLVEELGLEPGPELRRLEAAVLAQDPALDSAANRDPGPACDGSRRSAPTAPGVGRVACRRGGGRRGGDRALGDGGTRPRPGHRGKRGRRSRPRAAGVS